MPVNIIDQKVSQSFSQAAGEYDLSADLHQRIGETLLRRVSRRGTLRTILDVGMGTGWLTSRVKDSFPKAKVVGMDFAPGMVAYAKSTRKGFDIVQADANHLPFKKNSMDLVISNLAYQWIRELPSAFHQVGDVLSAEGQFLGAMFGYNTFCELFSCFEKMAGDTIGARRFSFNRLASSNGVEEALHQAGFSRAEIHCENIKVEFRDMIDLARWIKRIGANCLSPNIYLGRNFLRRAGDYYNSVYQCQGGVYATFEVIWIEAGKK